MIMPKERFTKPVYYGLIVAFHHNVGRCRLVVLVYIANLVLFDSDVDVLIFGSVLESIHYLINH